MRDEKLWETAVIEGPVDDNLHTIWGANVNEEAFSEHSSHEHAQSLLA